MFILISFLVFSSMDGKNRGKWLFQCSFHFERLYTCLIVLTISSILFNIYQPLCLDPGSIGDSTLLRNKFSFICLYQLYPELLPLSPSLPHYHHSSSSIPKPSQSTPSHHNTNTFSVDGNEESISLGSFLISSSVDRYRE